MLRRPHGERWRAGVSWKTRDGRHVRERRRALLSDSLDRIAERFSILSNPSVRVTTPRGSLRPRPRNPGTSWEPAPRGSRQSASGAAGSRDGHTSLRSSVRVARRFLAAGPWQTAPPAGDPPGVPRPTAVLRRSTRSFRRSFSRCRRSLLRCSLFTSRSRRVNFLWIRSTSASRCSIRFPSAFRFAVATPTVMPQFPKLYNCQDFDECGRAR